MNYIKIITTNPRRFKFTCKFLCAKLVSTMATERTNLTDEVYRSLSVDKSEKRLLTGYSDNGKKSNCFLYFSAIVGSLFIFCVSSGFSWTSSALEMLKSPDPAINPVGIPLTPMQESWIASLYPLGAVVGPLVSGKVADSLGRKKTLLVISVPTLICLLAMCFAKNVVIFYVSRFVMGLFLGTVLAVTPMYLHEISEVHNRGAIMSFLGVALNGGVLYCLLLGPLFSIKVLTLLCAIPLCLFIILFGLFVPESPVFLVSKNDKHKAVQALQKLRGVLNVEDELRQISKILATSETSSRHITDLIKDKVLRKALIISIGLMFALHFSGVNPVTAFLEAILKATGSTLPLYLSTNLVGVIQVLGTVIAIWLVEKMGRKTLLLFSLTGCFLSHTTLVIYFYLKDVQHYNMEIFSWLPVTCLLTFGFTFSSGLANLPITIMSEVYPHDVKAVGLSIGTSVCFAFSSIITAVFRMILEKHGLISCFLLLSICMLLSILFTYFIVPETKGKDEVEIQKMLKK